jgi:integration host factor subunit beta
MADSEIVRSELISNIVKKFPQLPEKDAEISINQIFEYISDALCKQKRIEIRDFGCFYLTKRAPRKAHNPRTGEIVFTKEKHVLRFKAGKGMRDRVNKKNEVSSGAAA